MYSAVFLTLAALAAPPTVTVETADGATVEGAVVSLDGASVVVKTDDDKEHSFTRAQLRRITAGRQKTSPPASAAAWIDLRDGSRLVASAYTAAAGKATIVLPSGEPAGTKSPLQWHPAR